MIGLIVGFILSTIGWAATGWLNLEGFIEVIKNLF